MHSLVSVITPTHNPEWLPELFESLKAQTHEEWQWVIVPNNGAIGQIPADILIDPRVKIATLDDPHESKVGALKRHAANRSDGEIIAEIDHDDVITPDCLEKVVAAFHDDEHVGMVYSNTVNIDMRNMTPIVWSNQYGWSYRPFEYKGLDFLEARSAAPYPQNLTRIWFAPNHIRAWRTSAYWNAGGHDPNMKISDDHDLTCRMYLTSKIAHIDEPLYIYRVHGENTWLKNMAEIQTTMWLNHDRYVLPMAIKWANDNGLLGLDLCSGVDPYGGLATVDLKNAQFIADLDKPWPFITGSVGVIRASDAVEHLVDPVRTMNEAHRVLAHGGFFIIDVPSTNGVGAWCDPTHKSFWNRRSFRYYTEASVRRYIEPMCTASFQALKLADVLKWNEQVPYVQAHLIALKDDSIRFYGEKLI
jgi:glycosyltransferase involved in cell wall biosynthesis